MNLPNLTRSNTLTRALRLLLVPVWVLSAGCGAEREDTDDMSSGTGTEQVSSEEQALVSDGTEVEQASSLASELAAIPTLAISAEPSPEEAAEAQSAATAFFQPEGCLTVAQSGNVVTYTFDHCTGPWGLIELNGQEIATFTPGDQAGSLALELHSADLTANAAPLDLDAVAQVTFPEGGKQIAWTGHLAVGLADGLTGTLDADLLWMVDAQDCRTTNGGATGSVGERGLTATFEELSRCGGSGTCAAGSITVETAMGLSATLELDGTATATITGPRGSERDVPLQCTAM